MTFDLNTKHILIVRQQRANIVFKAFVVTFTKQPTMVTQPLSSAFGSVLSDTVTARPM